MIAIKGNIHSLESFGTVDGPGIRFVVFLQGCPLRCLYCHNPDTWDIKTPGTYSLTASELLEEVLKYRSFIAKGGVTVSGGEPLLQADFLKEFFTLCRAEGIHTALDTSGCILTPKVSEVLQVTDLVMLDIKTSDPAFHPALTGIRLEPVKKFLDYLQSINKPVWIRHVVVPNLTDEEERLTGLASFLKNYPIIQKVELIPYHTMGVDKYKQLSIPYPLERTNSLPSDRLKEIQDLFRSYNLPV